MKGTVHCTSGEEPSPDEKKSAESSPESPEVPRQGAGPQGESVPEVRAQDPDALRKELEAARQETERNRDKWLRAEAELDNYRKRVQKEKYENFLYGHEKLVVSLLPVLDNLERAIDHAREMGLDQRILEGVELTYKQFLSALERYGVVPLSALGKEFDPGLHEAIMEEESQEHSPHTVIREVEKGYMLRDRLLRPSKVVLAKAHVLSAPGTTENGTKTGKEEANGGE